MFEYSASGDAAPDSRLEAAFVELLDRQATAPRGEGVSPEEPRAGCIDVLHPTRRTGRAWLYLGTTCSDRASDSAAAEAADVAESAGITTTASGETDAEPVAPLVHHLERGVEFLHEAREADREISRQAARRAQQLHAFARQRPMDLFDRAPGERGALSAAARAARPDALTDVSEWAVHEVSTAFNISRPAASGLLAQSVALVERLPATLAGLAEAQLTPAHASVMVEVVGPIDDADVRATAEHRLLDRLGRKTPPELRAAARRVVLRLDAKAAADRMVRAVRDRHVRLSDGRDGMAVLAAVLAGPIGQACLRTLAALAEETRTEGDERTHAQRMADCLADLILRPGQSGLPPGADRADRGRLRRDPARWRRTRRGRGHARTCGDGP